MRKLFFAEKRYPEKLIDAFLHDKSPGNLSQEQYKSLCQVYLNKDVSMRPDQLSNYILTKARKLKAHSHSLKVLLLLHKFSQTLKSEFVCNFSDQKFPDYSSQRKAGKERYSVLVYIIFIERYQLYLIKLFHNYEDFKLALEDFDDNEIEQHLAKQNISILHLLSKFQNILHHLLKFTPLFNVCFVQYPNDAALDLAAYYILSDCCRLYSFVTENVERLIDQVFTLPTHEAVALYEIYYENLQMSKKIKQIMQFTKYMADCKLREPDYLTLPAEQAKKIQVFINSIKARIQMEKMGLKIDISSADDNVSELKSTRNLEDTSESSDQIRRAGDTPHKRLEIIPVRNSPQINTESRSLNNSEMMETPCFDINGRIAYNAAIDGAKKADFNCSFGNKRSEINSLQAIDEESPNEPPLETVESYHPTDAAIQITAGNDYETTNTQYDLIKCEDETPRTELFSGAELKKRWRIQKTLTLGKVDFQSPQSQDTEHTDANDSIDTPLSPPLTSSRGLVSH